MERTTRLEIVEWREPIPARVAKSTAPRAWLLPHYIGFLGTLLLHSVIFPYVSFGESQKIREVQVQSSPPASATQGDESLVLVMLPPRNTLENAVVAYAPSMSHLISTKPLDTNLTLPRLLNVPVQASEPNNDTSTDSESTVETQAQLLGLYTGQIRARIERAWRRPRTSVNEEIKVSRSETDDTFVCQAEIVQDRRGNVEQIRLPTCNGSRAWRHSLIAAIQQASPLPAPPSESVFANVIAISFIGLPFSSDSAADEYVAFQPMAVDDPPGARR
jgi:hypothetical protein